MTLKPNEPPPEFLIRLKAQAEDSWREAYAVLYPLAWRGASHPGWSLPATDHEEVAADAIIATATDIHSLATWEEVTARVFLAARRGAVSRLRKILAQKRGAPLTVSLEPSELDAIEQACVQVTEPKRWHEVSALLEQQIAALGEPAAALLRDYLRGATYEELAERYDKPIGTVGVVIHRAFRQISRRAREEPRLMKELSLYLRLLILT